MDNSSSSSGSSPVNRSDVHVRKLGKRIPKRKRSFDYEDSVLIKTGKIKDRQSSSRRERLTKSTSNETGNRSVNKNIKHSRNRSRLNKIRCSLLDDNTTASDNSENAAIFNEINWEENIEVDSSSLLDEFAPRPPAASPSSDSLDSLKVTEIEVDEVLPISEVKPALDSSTMQETGSVEFEFTPGCHIHVMDYTTTTWLEGTVSEVDWDEEEVLVHYDGGKSDEWVSMNSQRLSRTKPKPTKPPVVDKNSTVSTSKVVPIDSQTVASKVNEPRKNVHSLQRRSRRVSRKDVQKSRVSKIRDRFVTGEKVLAKWSDHRMQKFPAVIKRVLGKGQYDVLFYDGFEKTIMGEDLYKATEEEVEKYQQSNPSEADLLFPMDIGSKEERRQRKKKTFDDYLFVKDYHRSRKKAEVYSDSSKATSSPMNRKPILTRSIQKTDLDDQKFLKKNKMSKPMQRIELRRRKLKQHQNLFIAQDIEPSLKEKERSEHVPEKRRSLDSKCVPDSSKLYYSSDRTLSEETSVSMEENFYEAPVPKKVVPSAVALESERWSGDVPRDVFPIKISGIDGILRKSVIVPDSNLPPGWAKHALLVKAGGNWDCFLISPEGYKLRTMEEVKEYYSEIKHEKPPEKLDMDVNMRTLPELVLKQNNLIAKGTCKRWDRKREKRRRKLTQIDVTNTPQLPVPHQVGRVRTLLPKYRTSSPVNIAQPSSPASGSASESEVWRCPKQGCDKKFRKENLLQMHIKHYHVEFKALVGSAPNMFDLALARSENVNSDRRQDPNKQGMLKRIMPKIEKQFEADKSSLTPQPPQTPSLSSQGPLFGRSDTPGVSEGGASPKCQVTASTEEKKTTIKTILPIRPTEMLTRLSHESDDGESDEDMSPESNFGDIQKPHTNRFYKQSRSKKAKTDVKHGSISSPIDDGVKDQGIPLYTGPKFIKKKQLTPVEKLQIITDSNDSYTEEEKISPNTEMIDEIMSEKMLCEEVINCICGFREEDGLMIQCDICLCWQHGLCYGIENESEVPDRYVCVICQNPIRVRSSKKFAYAQQYLTQAKLPSLTFRTSKEGEIRQRENTLKRCYDISASLHKIQNVEHSLRAKISIAQQSDHPKLYLWAKNWDATSNILSDEKHNAKDFQRENEEDDEEKSKPVKTSAPELEAPIDLEDCRLRLLDHIEQYQHQIESRLTTLQAQIAALESQDPDLASEEASDHYPLTKQTVHMLLRDLSTIKKVATIN